MEEWKGGGKHKSEGRKKQGEHFIERNAGMLFVCLCPDDDSAVRMLLAGDGC